MYKDFITQVTAVSADALEERNFKITITARGQRRWYIGCYPEDDSQKPAYMYMAFKRILDDLKKGYLPK